MAAFANVAIECGSNVNKEDGTVGTRVFLLSSENGQPMTAYNKADQPIKGAKISKGANGAVVLTITADRGLGGPVSEKYIIDDSNGQNFTKAHHIMIGGNAGGREVGTLDCVISEM